MRSIEETPMRNQRILRRLEILERVFAVEPRDDWIDIVMWNTSNSGIFGHTHCRLSESRSQTEWTPCSEEEEIAIMREHYERDDHRLYGRDTEVSFAEYLERFSNLGPKELEARRKQIIEQLKGEEDGARVADSSRRAC